MSIPKQLKGLFCLDHKIKIFVPSTVEVNQATDNSQQIKQALTLFSNLFGGSTAYQAQGAWMSSKDGLVIESVTIVESGATREALEGGLVQVLEFAQKLKKEMSQEAIALDYDNQIYFI